MNKALSYLRVSGLGQVDGDGFTRQREAIAEYAAGAGFEIVAEYSDQGVSGTAELADRVGLTALIGHLQANGVRVVIVERMDRLARDLVVAELLLNQFRELGVQVISADGNVDLTANTEPTAVFVRRVLAAVAELDKAMIVAKLAAARRRRRVELGRCEGKKPFGHFAGEAEILTVMRRLRQANHLSYAAIAEELNTRNLPSRGGKPWNPRSVYGILNPKKRPTK